MRRQVTFWMIVALLLAAGMRADERREKSGLYKAMGFALMGTAASDVLSTELALMSSADVREANPFMATSTEARIALKASTTTLVFVASDHLHKKGHEKMALWLRIATVAGYGIVTAHNLRQVK